MVKCWGYALEKRPTSQDLQAILAGFPAQDTQSGRERFPGDDPESQTAMHVDLVAEVDFREVIGRILPWACSSSQTIANNRSSLIYSDWRGNAKNRIVKTRVLY